jgi:hypothetical protein
MRLMIGLLVAGMAVATLSGCRRAAPASAPRPQPPPLKLSFRKSQIPTEGMVAGINNPSSSESIKVIAVFVKGKDEKEERSYRLDREVKPLDSISVGWVELNGWKLKPGDKLRIRCDGYARDLEGEVPE